MRVVCDVETNALVNPTHIWVIVCKDIDTNQYHIFREVTTNEKEKARFLAFAVLVNLWIGHNWLEFDYPVLEKLIGLVLPNICEISYDTLTLSRLVNQARPGGHSIERYGEEFGLEKGDIDDFSKYSEALEQYCVRDVDICHRIISSLDGVITDGAWAQPIALEQQFQYYCVNKLHDNGFGFNRKRAEDLLDLVTVELAKLDKEILDAFPPKLTLIREITPRLTRYGTLHKGDFRFVKDGDLSEYNGGPFSRCEWVPFNPSSAKQRIDVLNKAGWKPTDKTKSHIDKERELSKLQRMFSRNKRIPGLDIAIKDLYSDLLQLKKTGWKVNENNLDTLPDIAPAPAKTLALRILYESRRRTLTEWLALCGADGRIHGKFYGIGCWTGRMSHQKPNMANIPNAVKISDGSPRLLGKELRSLWYAPKRRLLVGVDAEAIQFRVFAHLINDRELINAIVNGNKKDKTDPHSYNKAIFGEHCKTRNASKHSMFAIFFGGRANKIAQIMGCTKEQAEEAIANLIARYEGLAKLENEVFPIDAKRGYFIGLDGRKVIIPKPTESERQHLCMSGYLQSGEAIIMKKATLLWQNMLLDDKELIDFIWYLVDLVHDEWQTEVGNNMRLALRVAQTQADSLKIVGEQLKMNCPLAGSFFNDDINDYTIGVNWYQTH